MLIQLTFCLTNHILEPPQKKPVQQITKQNLSKASKPPPKRPASVTKPGLRKPAMKSTYSSAFGRLPSAKSPQRPKSSRGSANRYLDSVLKKGDRRGTHSKLDLKEGGNIKCHCLQAGWRRAGSGFATQCWSFASILKHGRLNFVRF